MATLYANPGHEATSLEHIDLAHHIDPEAEKSMIDMETLSDDSSQDRVNVFVVFVFILEILVLIFVAVLEYFLRFVYSRPCWFCKSFSKVTFTVRS